MPENNQRQFSTWQQEFRNIHAKRICNDEMNTWIKRQVLAVNPLPDNNILDWSKLKQITDDILKCI